MLLPEIVSLKAIEKYKLDIKFADGVRGIYNLASLAGEGVFKAWDEGNNFYEVSVDKKTGAITWPQNLDIDTLNVYCKIRGISPEEYLSHRSARFTQPGAPASGQIDEKEPPSALRPVPRSQTNTHLTVLSQTSQTKIKT